jgi:phosphoesterase RecJ-like protein
MGIEKVREFIKRNKYFLITSHVNLEGDALGAELAFSRLVKKLGKHAVILNEDRVPACFSFLPRSSSISRWDRKSRYAKFDCLVVLDCSDLKRTGEVYHLNIDKKPVLNIDHHIDNSSFGDVNWIDPTSSSCSEMVYLLFKKMGVVVDKEASTCLYTGILNDTGSFRYSNTSSHTHKAVADLLKWHLDIRRIYKNIYEDVPLEDMELLTKILPGMRSVFGGKVIWFQIKRQILKQRRPSFDLSEHILNFGRAIKDVEVCVLFKENLGTKNQVRVNLRSQGKVNVNKIASFFGGGGHKTASGLTVTGNIDRVRRMVLAKIKESL